MKAMRVMILAVVALTGCGPQLDGEGSQDELAASERAITQDCGELNCQQPRTLIGPSGTNQLPQDPVPLHPDGPPRGPPADTVPVRSR